MIPVGAQDLFDSCQKLCRISENDQDELKEMKRTLNLALFDLSALRPFRSLRRSVTVSYAAGDSGGAWFPADMAGIYHAQDSNSNVYYPRDLSNILETEEKYRWYFSDPATEPLRSGSNLSINVGSKAVSGPTFTTAEQQEYVFIIGSMGVYAIDSASALATPYRGFENASDAHFSIRPEGTQKVAIVDDTAAFTAATVYFRYWVYPPPLTQPTHICPLPTTRALILLTAIRYWGDYKGQQKEADRLRVEYSKALSELKAAEPALITQSVPRDVKGRRFVFGRRRD